MRRKQLLGILLPIVVLCTMAAAAGTQLTGVNVAAQDDATTVTIRANGTFTHTEYRPSDNLLLVDLAGVSAGALDGKVETLHSAGVSSYRVLGFKGASGANVARVELTIAPSAGVHIREDGKGLHVRIATPQPASAPVLEKPATAVKPAAPSSQAVASARPVVVRSVAVARGKAGLNVEIFGNGPLEPKAMKLTGPDRVVIDLPNAVPAARARQLAVHHGDVKGVRVARYQIDPPVTRVVVDLAAAKDFELVPSGHKLTLKLREPAAASAPAAPAEAPASAPAVLAAAAPATPETAPAPPVATQAAPAPPQQSAASSFVVVQPEFHPKGETAETTPAPAMTPAVRAENAAAKFSSPKADVPLHAQVTPASSAALSAAQPAINAALEQQAMAPAAQTQAAPARRFTGEPISVNLKDVDLKDFFRLIHEISGLNIVLDPNVKGSLTLVLDDVPWDQALDIVLKNNGLEKELDGNVLRIATLDTMRKESDARRAQLEARALADPKVTVTRVLSYAHAQDVVPTIKKFLSQRGEIISDNRINALIIQDIPSVFPEVDRLLRELDRKTPEVEIEARVIAATRNFGRDIGFQWGFGWGDRQNAAGGAGSVGSSPLTRSDTATADYIRIGNSIPLFANLPAIGPTSGISFTTGTNRVRLDAILTMAESRGLLKILSRPRIVTQNNITAVVRQGVRIPVVTAAQLGGPPTTSYVDAFLRLTVVPQITAEGTIFLSVDVENTTPDFGRTVGNNPTLITQQAVTQVLVTDGGTVVIGGVIQTQNSVNIQQVPLLGSIPALGNLFKRRSVSTSTQELIFFITPKIIQT